VNNAISSREVETVVLMEDCQLRNMLLYCGFAVVLRSCGPALPSVHVARRTLQPCTCVLASDRNQAITMKTT
jgi:hypothetical protein